MELPVELRLQISEHLAVVGKVFYTLDAHATSRYKCFKIQASYRKSSLSVLRVSKDIHRKAEGAYLAKKNSSYSNTSGTPSRLSAGARLMPTADHSSRNKLSTR